MKKIKILALLILSTLIINGCAAISSDSNRKIAPPENKQLPIVGTWKVVDIIEGSANEEDELVGDWLGKDIRFSNDFIVLEDYILKEPQYQIKRVNGQEYLLYNHKFFLKDFKLPDEQIEVITVIDKDKFFCEIIRINDEQLVLSINKYNLYLKKISDEVNYNLDLEKGQNKNKNYSFQGSKEDDLTRSGVLIGLRTSDGKNNSENPNEEYKYSYRTLWISSKNKDINPILEMEGIIFPRRSGFWGIKVNRKTENGRTEDLLNAYKILTEKVNEVNEIPDLNIDDSQWENRIGKIFRRIDYIGNDYVSIEAVGEGSYEDSNKKWRESKLQVLPIDNLASRKNVRMIDLLGEDGVDSIKLGIQKAINSYSIDRKDIIYYEELLDNFGLERKLGHWFFKGRINHKKDSEIVSTDYSINVIPPSKLIFYDELYVPWTSIKDKVPGAVDAYVSPNKEIALVITKNWITVYGIKDGRIEKTPLQKIALKENEAVVMAEWATGHYVEEWNDFLLDLSNQN